MSSEEEVLERRALTAVAIDTALSSRGETSCLFSRRCRCGWRTRQHTSYEAASAELARHAERCDGTAAQPARTKAATVHGEVPVRPVEATEATEAAGGTVLPVEMPSGDAESAA